MAKKKLTSAPGPTELRERGLGQVGLTGTAAEIAAAKAAAAEARAEKETAAQREKREKQAAERRQAAEKRYNQLKSSIDDLKTRRKRLIDAIAEGTTPVIENQYRAQIEKFDERIATASKDLETAAQALEKTKTTGYKGQGTKDSPLTRDGKPFTGDYRGTKYKNGIKVTEAKVDTDIASTKVVTPSKKKDVTPDSKKDVTPKGEEKPAEEEAELTFAEIVSKAEQQYGELDSIFEQDNQLKKLLTDAVTKNYTEDRFLTELERTAWFQSNAGPIRQRQFYKNQYNKLVKNLKTDSPDYQAKLAELNQKSEYGRGLQSVIDALKEEETRQGKAMDDATRLAQAQAIYDLANESNPLAYRNAVISFGKLGATAVGGEAATALQNLRRVARANGFDLDTKYANQKDTWVNSILAGENPERFYALIRNDAAQNQGAYVKELMQNGYNLDDVYGNYINLMAQAFNVDPNTIDITDPLLQKVFTDKGGLKFNEFENLLRNDPRYQGTPGAFAEKDYRQSITDIAVAEGVFLTEEQIDDIANSALALGASASSSTVRSLIRAKLKYTPGSTVTGRAGNVLAELKSTAAANGLNLDTTFGSSIQGWLQNVAQGESIETYKRLIRQTAKLGLPEKVGALLDQGVDLDTIYSPYKNIMAATLEINPETIKLDDPVLRSAINQEGEMSIYDYQRFLRKDPRWQYTNNAREDVSSAALSALRDFGFQG